MQRLTVKTSTIFISKGERTRVYRSVEEIPKKLREELEQSTNGFNSATILIADRRGRAEIIRSLHGMPTGLRTRLASTLHPETKQAEPPAQRAWTATSRFLRRNWLEIFLPAAAGAVIWVAFNYR